MRILDIDLDFFLSDVHRWGQTGKRANKKFFIPWPEASVRRFLEDRCGLSTSAPRPGKLVEVFHDWQERIDTGDLSTPFEGVHVDRIRCRRGYVA